MPGTDRPLTETQLIADLRKQMRLLRTSGSLHFATFIFAGLTIAISPAGGIILRPSSSSLASTSLVDAAITYDDTTGNFTVPEGLFYIGTNFYFTGLSTGKSVRALIAMDASFYGGQAGLGAWTPWMAGDPHLTTDAWADANLTDRAAPGGATFHFEAQASTTGPSVDQIFVTVAQIAP